MTGHDAPVWSPGTDRIRNANLTAFIEQVALQWGASIPDYNSLRAFSLGEPEKFWRSVISFSRLVAETWGERTLINKEAMPGARWFPDAYLNFAENLLQMRGGDEAIVFRGEDGQRRSITYDELGAQVSRVAQAMSAAGVDSGDRVAAYMPNIPETVICMLAAVSLGAVWSSCSPDFGVQGVVDRFGQIGPKLLIAADRYTYGGRTFELADKVSEIAAQIPTIETIVIVPFAVEETGAVPSGASSLESFLAPYRPRKLSFRRLPFNSPLYIMYSSGTTGAPKCIVHGAGGTLLKHASELLLHCNVKQGDRVFYFTTCGWMMWNWQISALLAGATLMLYDGSPFHPDGNVLWDYAEDDRITLFGASAKYIDAVRKAGLKPRHTHDLSALKLITSTGSPLAPESFDFVYAYIKPDVHLASISGGTDIIGCFVLGNPIAPVWRGEIQTAALGVAVEVFDDHGQPVRGRAGDLVCTAPFPSMPIYFWNDPGNVKYKAAYFERFPGVWCHGDWAEITNHDGVIMYGRSDATLNPGGVRIGTSEIYRQVEQFEEVLESIGIGQEWDGDTRIVLFVVMRPEHNLTEALVERIRQRIRENCSPRHVPARIIAVPEIPRTRSGKISEIAVREVVHGRPVKNKQALANPEALAYFADLDALKS